MMKTLFALMAIFLAVSVARGKEIQLSEGMSSASAVRILRGIATDISVGFEIMGENRGGFCWKLKDYDLVILLDATAAGKIWAFRFWTKKGFDVYFGKGDYDPQMARRITFDTDKHTYKVEKFPKYFPTEMLSEESQASLVLDLLGLKEPILLGKEKDKNYMALRVLCFSCDYRRSALIRYETRGKRCWRRSILLHGQMPGKIAKSIESETPQKELSGLMASLEKAGLWKLPKDEGMFIPSVLDKDSIHGTVFLIEAIRGGEYRVRKREEPSYETERRGLFPLVRFYTGVFQEAGLWKKGDK